MARRPRLAAGPQALAVASARRASGALAAALSPPVGQSPREASAPSATSVRGQDQALVPTPAQTAGLARIPVRGRNGARRGALPGRVRAPLAVLPLDRRQAAWPAGRPRGPGHWPAVRRRPHRTRSAAPARGRPPPSPPRRAAGPERARPGGASARTYASDRATSGSSRDVPRTSGVHDTDVSTRNASQDNRARPGAQTPPATRAPCEAEDGRDHWRRGRTKVVTWPPASRLTPSVPRTTFLPDPPQPTCQNSF